MTPSCDGSNCGACACEVVKYVDGNESQELIEELRKKIDLLEDELQIKYEDIVKKQKEEKERAQYEKLKKKFE